MDLDSDGAATAAVMNEGSSSISIETNEEAIWQMNLRELESELYLEHPGGSDITSISIGRATLRAVGCRTRGGHAWCKECSMINVALQELISKRELPVPQQDLNAINREQPSLAVILIIIKRKLEDEDETHNNLSSKMSHELVRRSIFDQTRQLNPRIVKLEQQTRQLNPRIVKLEQQTRQLNPRIVKLE
ncbi:uncharacterized protein LOC109824342 isoform X2 [Asparagus officinalis]|uniref:uncharacterized protein LOC109824342 isoform X2 n=1 Tax=Asparagus officinalis TaxID=4686 RepID=UPI00098DE6AE|nr:uncharacterized protein LOC109824342 isoform X2 [Asparagus officinalis]